VLRHALEGHVPREILHRKKMGFPVPFGVWLRGPLRSLLEDFVVSSRALDRGLFEADLIRQMVREHRAGAGNHWDPLWLLINLEIWQRIFLDGEEPAAVLEAA
jgi:asparagine synthase (glutamine-hydrolysing)